jgi:pSer/pThr/pTyr-binding forkhead associated (FHA) protein
MAAWICAEDPRCRKDRLLCAVRTPATLQEETHHRAPWTALLEVNGPGGHRSSLPFRPPRVVVGRKRTGNDLSLPDQGVSSSHCEFAIEGGWLVVRDLASINGTFVNDRRVSEARLRDGDVVRLGATKITVALSGSLRNDEVLSVGNAKAHWKWLVAGGALILLALGGGALYRRSLEAEQRLRSRYALEVRELLQTDPCAAVAARIQNLVLLDQRIGGRAVPMAGPGRKPSPEMTASAVELLGIYRAKGDEARAALQQLGEEQKRERDAQEKVTRLSQKFSSSQDRKIAFFMQGQLAERLKTGDALLFSLTVFAQETQKFAELIEAVALRGDQWRSAELIDFRFTAKSASDQLSSCQSDLARTNAGALGAINGFADE